MIDVLDCSARSRWHYFSGVIIGIITQRRVTADYFSLFRLTWRRAWEVWCPGRRPLSRHRTWRLNHGSQIRNDVVSEQVDAWLSFWLGHCTPLQTTRQILPRLRLAERDERRTMAIIFTFTFTFIRQEWQWQYGLYNVYGPTDHLRWSSVRSFGHSTSIRVLLICRRLFSGFFHWWLQISPLSTFLKLNSPLADSNVNVQRYTIPYQTLPFLFTVLAVFSNISLSDSESHQFTNPAIITFLNLVSFTH